MKNSATSHVRELHNDTFIKISQEYDVIQDVVGKAVYGISQEYCKTRLPGKSVLDVGNGGVSKEKLLGKDLAGALKNFVAIDQCFEMLARDTSSGLKITGDAFSLPFADKSFDYVLLNGMIHHIGFKTTLQNKQRVAALVKELQRVCRYEIIVTEIFVSPLLEAAERVVAFFLGYMHTFVLSENTLDEILKLNSSPKENVQIKTLTQLSRWNYWYLVFLALPWFKIPAFLSPFKWAFFTIPSSFPSQNIKEETAIFSCPKCRGGIQHSADSYTCVECNAYYPIKKGIPVFL